MKRVTTEDLNEDLDNGDVEPIDTPEVDIPDEQVPAAATDIATELESEHKDVDDINTGMDNAVDAQSQLDELKQAVEENGEDGRSLSATEELAVNVAMESIHESLGLKWAPPTMESVTYRKRREAVVATLESAENSLKDKIVAGFKKAMAAIMNFISNLLRNNWILKKYIGVIRERVKKLKGDAPTKETMPESATAMSVNGTSDYESVALMYKSAMGGLDLTDKAVDEVNKLNFTYMELTEGSIGRELNPANYMRQRNGSERNAAGFLTGDRAYIMHDEFQAQIGVREAFNSIKRVEEPATEATVLTKDQMGEVLSKADDIVKEIAHAERNRSKIKNIISRVTQTAAEVVGMYGSTVSKNARALTWNLTNISAIRRVMNSIITNMPLEAFKTAKAFTDYVRHSLKYYKSAEA